MQELLALFALPPYDPPRIPCDELDAAWLRLSTGQILLAKVKESVGARAPEQDWQELRRRARSWHDEYCRFDPARHAAWLRQFRLVWAAEQAATNATLLATWHGMVDGVQFEQQAARFTVDLPDCELCRLERRAATGHQHAHQANGEHARGGHTEGKQPGSPDDLNEISDHNELWGCLRLVVEETGILGPASAHEAVVRARAEVPVAFVEGGRGATGTLALEILGPGAGRVFQHPVDYLAARPKPDFVDAITTAWRAARAQIGHERPEIESGPELLVDGRWRLLRDDGWPLVEGDGRSAGGAAARGWYHALLGLVPDAGVVVMTTVNEDGSLGEVQGVEKKARAVLDAPVGTYDTIVVAGPDNEREAKRAIGRSDHVRVINLETWTPPPALQVSGS